MKTKEMSKIEATIRATESLVQWIADSDQLSDKEKQEATLKQMRQLNALIAAAKNTNEKHGSIFRGDEEGTGRGGEAEGLLVRTSELGGRPTRPHRRRRPQQLSSCPRAEPSAPPQSSRAARRRR